MVRIATALGRTGLHDWVLQRISAVVLGAYFLIVAFWLVTHPTWDYQSWFEFNSNVYVKTVSIAALISVLVHGWVGLWTVTTDYLKNTALRFCVQMALFSLLIGYLVWGLKIVWGI